MDPTADELAGVVDLFGALTRTELGWALSELAFKRGEDASADAFTEDVETAVESYHLVVVSGGAVDAQTDGVDGSEELLVVGPAAFPALPDGGEDLPHIMDVETRRVERSAAVAAARERFESEVEAAVADGDRERAERLVDVSYDLEAWGGLDLADARDRLDRAGT